MFILHAIVTIPALAAAVVVLRAALIMWLELAIVALLATAVPVVTVVTPMRKRWLRS